MNTDQKITIHHSVLYARVNRFAAISALLLSFVCLPSVLLAKIGPVTNHADGTAADSSKGITIHQEINFKAAPKQIYEALLSSKQFSESTKKSFNNFTAASAHIDPSPGGAFALFDGIIVGRILELVPNQGIVEAWRAADWPAGVYSIVRFELKPQGTGTRVIFDHTGFPEGLKENPIGRVAAALLGCINKVPAIAVANNNISHQMPFCAFKEYRD
jgi:uncharacterized protein YndB with AHSA1/START domain